MNNLQFYYNNMYTILRYDNISYAFAWVPKPWHTNPVRCIIIMLHRNNTRIELQSVKKLKRTTVYYTVLLIIVVVFIILLCNRYKKVDVPTILITSFVQRLLFVFYFCFLSLSNCIFYTPHSRTHRRRHFSRVFRRDN